jgi:N-methylhydantoinase A/oxoprolinase/acetone carboxylase beta subunit
LTLVGRRTVAVDVGGTSTDLVAAAVSGEIVAGKAQERERELTGADLIDEYISQAAARGEYGYER